MHLDLRCLNARFLNGNYCLNLTGYYSDCCIDDLLRTHQSFGHNAKSHRQIDIGCNTDRYTGPHRHNCADHHTHRHLAGHSNRLVGPHHTGLTLFHYQNNEDCSE